MSTRPATRATRVLAALLRIGWHVKRQKGTSHKMLARDGGRTPCGVPRPRGDRAADARPHRETDRAHPGGSVAARKRRAAAIRFASIRWANAESEQTCVAEVFQASGRSIAGCGTLVGRLPARACARLLDLTGRWSTRAGASMAIHSGSRARGRESTRAIHQAFPRVQGLLACSSMDSNRLQGKMRKYGIGQPKEKASTN
jgi:predicted RNA binding protein YcfA (HicA-like mRNA interferase family)